MKVLLIDESESRSKQLQERLTAHGCAVFVHLGWGSVPLQTLLASYDPDVIVLDSRRPTRAALPDLLGFSPQKPTVVFAEEADGSSAEEIIEAGAHAYFVGDTQYLDVGCLLESAIAQFRRIEKLKQEIIDGHARLTERKVIDRAKGILMKSRSYSEDEAYHTLRRMAMEKKLRLADIAEQVVHMAELLQ